MDDTVYRKDVIKALEDMSGGYSYIETTTLGAITTIRELPSAQRTGRKKGKWLKHGGMIYCSNCANSFEKYFVDDFIYCPNCGCAMKGEDE